MTDPRGLGRRSRRRTCRLALEVGKMVILHGSSLLGGFVSFEEGQADAGEEICSNTFGT